MNFEDAIFNHRANFKRAIFGSNAKFLGTQFLDDVSFSDAEFYEKSEFDVTFFGSYSSFDKVRFKKASSFFGAKFNGDVAIFEGGKFWDDVNFQGVSFGRFAQFKCVKFYNGVNFNSAIFGGDVLFDDAFFDKIIDLSNIKVNDIQLDSRFASSCELNLKRANYERLLCHWDIIKPLISSIDENIYLKLIKNFENLGLHDEAERCYKEYRDKCRISKKIFGKYGLNWSKVEDYISWILCGYGTQLKYILGWIVSIILIFSYLFYKYNMLDSYPLKTENLPTNIQNASFNDWLYLSVMAFISKIPPNISLSENWRYAFMFEGLLGWLLFALLTAVLIRRLIR